MGCSIASTLWTWGYARLAAKIGRASPEALPSDAASQAARLVGLGITLNMVGMLLCIVGAEAIVGTLGARPPAPRTAHHARHEPTVVACTCSPCNNSRLLRRVHGARRAAAKALTTSQSAVLGVAASPVQALDMLIVQANTNIILAHFVGLAGCMRVKGAADKCAQAEVTPAA